MMKNNKVELDDIRKLEVTEATRLLELMKRGGENIHGFTTIDDHGMVFITNGFATKIETLFLQIESKKKNIIITENHIKGTLIIESDMKNEKDHSRFFYIDSSDTILSTSYDEVVKMVFYCFFKDQTINNKYVCVKSAFHIDEDRNLEFSNFVIEDQNVNTKFWFHELMLILSEKDLLGDS